jgi:hypothetical protein
VERPALTKHDRIIRKPLAASLHVGFLLRPGFEEAPWLIGPQVLDIDADFSVRRSCDERQIG